MSTLDLKRHFTRFVGDGRTLHFTAHSHHPWPDLTRDAQLAAWDAAASLIDDKWNAVLGPVLHEAQSHIARQLSLPDRASVVFAPNTHELVTRLLSCTPPHRAPRVLTTDGEFHSLTRQLARLEEDGLVTVTRVPVEPFDTLTARLVDAARAGHDLVYVSHVFFNSGYVFEGLDALVEASGDALIALDGYHAFMARPVDVSRHASRVFYLAGGYKYAMAGEGVCFMHCPPGWGPRPRDTGWYAAFGALAKTSNAVAYADDGWRFMGATFDPSGLYRFNAVQAWLRDEGVTVERIHDHACALQQQFLDGLPRGPFSVDRLVLPRHLPHGNFLTFDLDDAGAVQQRLHAAGVVTDVRGRRLRVGFGVCHVPADVDALLDRLTTL